MNLKLTWVLNLYLSVNWFLSLDPVLAIEAEAETIVHFVLPLLVLKAGEAEPDLGDHELVVSVLLISCIVGIMMTVFT